MMRFSEIVYSDLSNSHCEPIRETYSLELKIDTLMNDTCFFCFRMQQRKTELKNSPQSTAKEQIQTDGSRNPITSGTRYRNYKFVPLDASFFSVRKFKAGQSLLYVGCPGLLRKWKKKISQRQSFAFKLTPIGKESCQMAKCCPDAIAHTRCPAYKSGWWVHWFWSQEIGNSVKIVTCSNAVHLP